MIGRKEDKPMFQKMKSGFALFYAETFAQHDYLEENQAHNKSIKSQ